MLKQQTISHGSGVLKVQGQGVRRFGSWWGLSGSLKATILLCAHMTSSSCADAQRAQVFLPLFIRMLIPLLVKPSWPHLNLITSQCSLTLRVSTYEFGWGGDWTNVQSAKHYSHSFSLNLSPLSFYYCCSGTKQWEMSWNGFCFLILLLFSIKNDYFNGVVVQSS